MSELQQEIRHVRRLGRLLAVLTLMLLAVLAIYAWPVIRNRFFAVQGARPITPRGDLMDFEKTTISICKKASPSVVFVTTKNHITLARRVQDTQESGSGFIWDAAGHIVTNYHVIEHSTDNPNIHVILSDQTSYEAAIIGADPEHDLAVLQINPPFGVDLIPIPLGTSHDLQVGQSVFAIGNPFGLDQTVTTGIISALKRAIGNSDHPIEDAIQTDAAINPGNSGGPLHDSAGRLIGINTAIVSQTGTSAGIGFAIPVDTANRVIPQIIVNRKYQHAHLGLEFDDRLQFRLPANVQGLAISGINPDAPAASSGLVPAHFNAPTSRGRGGRGFVQLELGDVITQINGKPVKTNGDLFTIMDHVTPGDTVELTVWSNGQTRQVKVATQ